MPSDTDAAEYAEDDISFMRREIDALFARTKNSSLRANEWNKRGHAILDRFAALTPTASEATAIGAGEVDWAAVGREYAQKSLSGGVPQVRSPQYALSGVFTAMADEIERLRNAASPKVASDTAPGVRGAVLFTIKRLTVLSDARAEPLADAIMTLVSAALAAPRVAPARPVRYRCQPERTGISDGAGRSG